MRDLPVDVDAAFLEALDASPALMWLSEDDFEGKYFNLTWREFTGRSLEEEVGRGWMSGVHPDDLCSIEACGSALRSRSPFRVEYRLRRHDGAWRWMLDSGRPRFDRSGAFVGYVGSCIDISDRKETEEALARSGERLRLAQEAAAIGTYDWDIQGNAVSWSPEMFRLYALDPEAPAEDLYASWLASIHPDDRARVDVKTKEVVQKAEDLSIEFRILHPDKGERWLQGRGRMKRDENGCPVRMTGINIDITEQRRTEDSLRESEQRIRDIAENFPGIIFRRITYPDGRVEYPFYSGVDEAVFNVPREQLEGVQTIEAVSKLIHYDDLDEMLAKFAHASATLTPLELEGRVLGKNGEVNWVRSISRPRRRDDGALIWDGVILNVTDQHRRGAERERATAMLQMSMEVAGVGTWEYDAVTDTVQGSAVTNRAFGLPEDDVARPLSDYVKSVHPDDVDRVRDHIVSTNRIGQASSGEYRLSGTSGEERWLSSTSTFVQLADGTRRTIGALSDVTRLKRQEADREATLHHQAELLRELNHRVKNNLQLVLALLRMQSRRTGSSAALAGVIGQVETVTSLYGRLSFVSAAGQVDFSAHLRDTLNRRTLRVGADITLHLTAQDCMLDLDRAVPLSIVVHELVGNAIRRASSAPQPANVTVSLATDDTGACTVTVGESGCGDAGRALLEDLDLRFLQGLCHQIGAGFEQLEGQGVAHRVVLAGKQESD